MSYSDLILDGYAVLGEQLCAPRYHTGMTEDDNGRTIPWIGTLEEAKEDIKDYIEDMNDGHKDDEDFEPMTEDNCDMFIQRVKVVGTMMMLLDDDGEIFNEFNWTAQI